MKNKFAASTRNWRVGLDDKDIPAGQITRTTNPDDAATTPSSRSSSFLRVFFSCLTPFDLLSASGQFDSHNRMIRSSRISVEQ